LRSNKNVYVGNATTVRDYRVQLRGIRSILLFGLYLVILIAVAMFVYAQTASRPDVSIVEAQADLRGFSTVIMILLGFAITLVAPGLTATAVVVERQRQSLDLVFSAPVTPKYYLVGKIISSLRYTWMLLVLALPITAASVVLGGASWTDVLIAYFLLSLQGLVLTAFALLISTIAAKPVGAIIWSYAATFLYNMFVFPLSVSYTVGRMFGGGGRGNAAPWWVTLSPFSVLDTARTYTEIGTHQIPNWIFALCVTLLVCKICLLGAGVLLSPSGGKEIYGLRIHALVYVAVMAFIVGWVTFSLGTYTDYTTAPTLSGSPITKVETLGTSILMGHLFAFCTAPLVLFVPFIACFGFDRERRYWPNGVFSLRRILDGTPGGGLPFLVSMLGVAVLAWFAGAWFGNKSLLRWPFWAFAFYTATFWIFFWAIGRLVSSFFAGLKTSRALVFALFLFLVALPFPFITVIAGSSTDRTSAGPWDLYILSPLLSMDDYRSSYAIIFGVILATLSVIMVAVSEQRVKKKMAAVRRYDEQPVQAA